MKRFPVGWEPSYEIPLNCTSWFCQLISSYPHSYNIVTSIYIFCFVLCMEKNTHTTWSMVVKETMVTAWQHDILLSITESSVYKSPYIHQTGCKQNKWLIVICRMRGLLPSPYRIYITWVDLDLYDEELTGFTRQDIHNKWWIVIYRMSGLNP